jgi:hypothetical protein
MACIPNECVVLYRIYTDSRHELRITYDDAKRSITFHRITYSPVDDINPLRVFRSLMIEQERVDFRKYIEIWMIKVRYTSTRPKYTIENGVYHF